MFKRLILALLLAPAPALADTAPVAQPVAIGSHACGAANYPEGAVRAHAEGTATVDFKIMPDGSVKDVAVSKSTGNADLDAASVSCVAAWRYQPNPDAGELQWHASVAWRMDGHTSCPGFAAVTAQMLNGIGGVTRLAFKIRPDGTVKDAQVTLSSGNATLDDAALACIQARRYDLSNVSVPPGGFPQDTSVDWHGELGPAPN